MSAPWIVASVAMPLICAGMGHAFDHVPLVAAAPVVEHKPAAYAQAINVVEINGQPPVRQFIVDSERALAQNRQRVIGAPKHAP